MSPDVERRLNGVAIVVFVAAMAFILLRLSVGCMPASSPRAQARSVVLTVAEGVRAADRACAVVALQKESEDLARECDKAVTEARRNLLLAEGSVDVWDDASEGQIACAVSRAVNVLRGILDVVRDAGGKPPAAVEDALLLSAGLVGACRG